MRRINERPQACELLEKALEERIRCEKKYPHDLGVKEDLVKNIAEIIGLRCRPAIEL